jgi:ribokinase
MGAYEIRFAAGHRGHRATMPVRVAVVGHVEWMEFAEVSHVPVPGEIVDATSGFEEVAGSGSVAAVQLAKLAGAAQFFTALAGDERGRRSAARLRELGVEVHAAPRQGEQRHGFCHLDADNERTITIVGDRLVPHGDDDLPWERLADVDAVYVTGGDAGAVRAARQARRLVATPRALDGFRDAGIRLDALVGSAKDRLEAIDRNRLKPSPELIVQTRGAEGGEWHGAEHREGRWTAAPLPGDPVDTYGAGDSFAAGFTYGLAAGMAVDEALALASRCGAANMSGRGPYAGQLTTRDL